MEPEQPSTAGVALVQRLFLQNISEIKGFIFGLMPDMGSLEDVLHDVFLVVTDKSGAFVPGSDFLSWVWAIARNKVLERQRARRRALTTFSTAAIDALCTAPQLAKSSELTAAKSDALQHCMERLSPKARQAVELRYGEACRPPEIAKRLSLTVGSASVTLSRALNALRDCVRRKLAEAEAR